jgi:dCTP deaminase
MILTHDQIIKEIESRRIRISPFDIKSVGPASVDLALDNEIRVFERIGNSVAVNEHTDFKTITRKISIKDNYIIKPGELVLGITIEKITLPGDIAGWLNSRSRFARLGLMVHITAPFIQPGISGKQVLEIYNAGPNNLELIPGQKLCQLILQRCEGSAIYKGGFTDQSL